MKNVSERVKLRSIEKNIIIEFLNPDVTLDIWKEVYNTLRFVFSNNKFPDDVSENVKVLIDRILESKYISSNFMFYNKETFLKVILLIRQYYKNKKRQLFSIGGTDRTLVSKAEWNGRVLKLQNCRARLRQMANFLNDFGNFINGGDKGLTDEQFETLKNILNSVEGFDRQSYTEYLRDKICQQCGMQATAICSCMNVFYCGEKCQTKDWGKHKNKFH